MWKIPGEEIERCALEIERFHTSDDAHIDNLIDRIAPTVRRLAGGISLLSQIKKLILAGNAARAAKLVRSYPRWSAIPLVGLLPDKWRAYLWAPLVLCMVPIASYTMPRCNGGYDLAMQSLNACPSAREVLGAPVELAPFGLSCGSSETRGGGFGHAQWSMRVAGPKGSAWYRYGAESHGGNWNLVSAELSLGDGEKLDVLTCAPAGADTAKGGGYDKLLAGATWTGRVTQLTGTSVVNSGQRCTIDVSPSAERFRSRGYNCHVKVACGSTVLYGWEGSGVTHCRVENGRVAGVLDDTGAAEKDDPRLSVEPAGKRVVVSDNEPGASYEILIVLE